MNILAVDATGEVLTAAVETRGRVFAVRKSGQRPHDELLLPAVDAVLKRARISYNDLDAVTAAAGPGRFTGIRIGMSFAAIVGMKLNIPAFALSRLEAVAEKSGAEDVLAALPGWKNEVYSQRYRRLVAADEAAWTSPEEWPRVRAEAEAKGITVSYFDTDAADLLPVARRRLKAKKFPPFAPFYLKPAGYEKKPAR